jgi:hypothetical protein
MRLFSYFQWIDIGQYNSTKKAYHMFPFLFLQLFTPPKKVCCGHMQSVSITYNIVPYPSSFAFLDGGYGV